LVSFVNRIAARILIATLLWGLLGFMLGVYVVVTKLLGYYTPGWTTIVLFSLLQVFILLVTSLLIVLNLSKTSNMLTQKDLDFRVIP
jgi:cation transporter-like permease